MYKKRKKERKRRIVERMKIERKKNTE